MTIGILLLAHAMRLTVTEQFTTLLVILFTSKGAAGITGGGFIALAATLPAVNRWAASRFFSASIALWQRSGRHQPDQQCHRDAGCGAMDCDRAARSWGANATIKG